MADINKTMTFEGRMRVLAEERGLQQKVEVMLLNSKVNRNNWQYVDLEKHRRLFAETPILIAYVGNKVGDGHNYDEVADEDGNVTASYMSATAERIVGWFKSEDDIRLETIDDTEWIVGTGYIWKWYAQELVAKLNGQGVGDSTMSVSIETLVYGGYEEDGVEVYTDYEILGTTILGDDVEPAVVSASIRALSALGRQGIREMTLRVASANPQSECGNNNEGDAGAEETPPEGVPAQKGQISMNINAIEALVSSTGRILAVNEDHVMLLTSDGSFVRQEFSVDEDDNVTLGAQTALNAVVSVGEGECAVSVPLDEYRRGDLARIDDLTERLNAAEQANATANETIDVMRKRETNRRIEAVREAINSRFEEVRSNAEAELSDNACDSLLTDEKVAEYASMESEDGEWCGDVAACRDVDAICMESVIKAGKKRRANAAHRFAFDIPKKSENGDDIDALIDSMMN